MPALACPLCRQPLQREGARYACADGHAFDVAREGYVNLLPVQHRKSRAPGDSPAMVAARRDFLAAGHYLPVRDAVAAALQSAGASVVLDLGCGEGWYTSAMAAVAPDVTGLDISKAAVRLAARAYPGITWVVAGGARLPLADGSVDAACSLFGPLPSAELRRVLKPGGLLLVATPGDGHLHALRAALFDEVRPHVPGQVAGRLGEGWVAGAPVDLHFPLVLDRAALEQLLLMTPYAWRARPERRAALLAGEGLVTAAHVCLLPFRTAAG